MKNIVKTFKANFQDEEIIVNIEKVSKGVFNGNCNIKFLKTRIEYNQAGSSAEDVEKKVLDFFSDQKVKETLK